MHWCCCMWRCRSLQVSDAVVTVAPLVALVLLRVVSLCPVVGLPLVQLDALVLLRVVPPVALALPRVGLRVGLLRVLGLTPVLLDALVLLRVALVLLSLVVQPVVLPAVVVRTSGADGLGVQEAPVFSELDTPPTLPQSSTADARR